LKSDDKLDLLLERLQRVEWLLDEMISAQLSLDEGRAYSDAQVCLLLGNISRSTLWRIRKQIPSMIPTALIPGGAARTTGRQIAAYLASRERAADVLNFTSTGRCRSSDKGGKDKEVRHGGA
jgi:hypothetical protein